MAGNRALTATFTRRHRQWTGGASPRHHDRVSAIDIYRGRRPEDVPAYSAAEAAALVNIARSTLRTWVHGRPYVARGKPAWFQPVIRLPKDSKGFLSFTNLVEAHALAALRRKHRLSLKTIRTALRFTHDKLKIEHPLASEDFRTNGIDLFIGRLGSLINVSREGQLAMKEVLERSLERVEYDAGHAVRLFPLLRDGAPRSIIIDPRRAFGRPVIEGTSVPVEDVRARFDAGDSVMSLSDDFEVAPELIEDALRATAQAA